jgi:hypothetical protein
MTQFAKVMYKMEEKLQESNFYSWQEFESESGGLWNELGAYNWNDAYKADPMACLALKQKLNSLVENG